MITAFRKLSVHVIRDNLISRKAGGPFEALRSETD